MRWSLGSTRTLLKLVGFALTCVVLTTWLAVRIGNLSLFSHTVSYGAELADATGLASGAQVAIAGVDVGQVQSVSVSRAHATVDFSLDRGVHIRQGTGVGLKWRNVLGQMTLYLYPSATGAVLRPGAVLPLSADVADASVGRLLDTLGPLLQAIDPAEANAFLQAVAGTLQGNTAQVRTLITNAAKVASTVGSVNTQFGAVIGNLDQVLGALAARKGDLAMLVGDLAQLAGTLANHNALLDSTVGNLAQVQRQLAGLLSTNRNSLDGLISGLRSVASDLASHQVSLAAGLRTLPEGLVPYAQISSGGQWFQIETVFTCLADQTTCTYYAPAAAPGGSTNLFPSGLGGLAGVLQGVAGSRARP